MNSFDCALWVFALLGTQTFARAQSTQTVRRPAQSKVEEIYVARSVRQSRVPPTEFCAKATTGVGDALFEDQYTFRSIATRTSDDRILDANVKAIRSIHACFGATGNPAISTFFGDVRLGALQFKGIGECHQAKSNFPETGVNVFNCFLDLSGLPGEYVGGLLTTNSLASLKSLGTETDPAGYTQASIATVRLWKKRTER
jgi:hypothetical protein